MHDPFADALDLKDRYASFLTRLGRLSYRGDVQEFKNTYLPGTKIVIGELLGQGAYADVRALDVIDPLGNRTALVQRAYCSVDLLTAADALTKARRDARNPPLTPEAQSLSQALNTLPPEMHGPILRRLQQERNNTRAQSHANITIVQEKYNAALKGTAGQFGRILGLSLDAGLEDAIAPIIGFARADVQFHDIFLLYQPRDEMTLKSVLTDAKKTLEKGVSSAATKIADVVDATCALVGRTGAAGYVDSDFKSVNIGVTRKPNNGGYTVRTLDIGELRPVGALRTAFEEHIAAHPEDKEFLPNYMTGSMTHVPVRKLEAFSTKTPTPRQATSVRGDDRTALALTIADDLFGLYDHIQDEDAYPGPIDRRVLHARCAFLEPEASKTAHPALLPYRSVVERAIAADISGSEYPTGEFLQDVRTASGDVRAYARRAR